MKGGDIVKKRGITVDTANEIRSAKKLENTKLQQLRMKKGISQHTLSVMSGVSVRAIQGYEQKKRGIEHARLETLCALCIALNCKIEDVIEDKALIDKFKLVK